jgi:hypothetical protein
VGERSDERASGSLFLGYYEDEKEALDLDRVTGTERLDPGVQFCGAVNAGQLLHNVPSAGEEEEEDRRVIWEVRGEGAGSPPAIHGRAGRTTHRFVLARCRRRGRGGGRPAAGASGSVDS